MKIVFVVVRLADDGGSRMVVDWANCLSEKGHQVSIMLPRGTCRMHFPIMATVKEVGLALPWRLPTVLLGLLLTPFMAPPADIYIGTMPPIPLVVFLLSRIWRATGWNIVQGDDVTLFDERSRLKSLFLLKIYRRVALLSLRLPLKLVANSHWTVGRVMSYTGRACPIIHPLIDTEIFRPSDTQYRPAPSWEIVCIGARARSKGTGEVIEAVNALWGEGIPLRLTIISKDELQFGNLPFPVRLIHPKTDEELSSICSLASVFVHAAWQEGFALPPLEAMACGVAVVLADSGGPREYAVDGYNCLLVPPKNAPQLAAAIRRLLSDPSLARQLAENGVRTAAKFDKRLLSGQVERLLLGGASSGDGSESRFLVTGHGGPRKGRPRFLGFLPPPPLAPGPLV